MILQKLSEKHYHQFGPVYNESSRILILGSFPSVKSRESNFYYANPQNRFWPLMSKLFGCHIPESNDGRASFLLEHHIALWDVIESCDIYASADSSISNVIPVRITDVLDRSETSHIFCNGSTAYSLYCRYLEKASGMSAVKLPSTSPANARCNLDMLFDEWFKIVEALR